MARRLDPHDDPKLTAMGVSFWVAGGILLFVGVTIGMGLSAGLIAAGLWFIFTAVFTLFG